ncbi:MAG TPA: Type 1 glutamine amidotransferase-like domain-containing protein [Microlunatus sp.]|nr:Type 1 glutamine amidotransferase-like domain-containing protein [Microlunatus sp.]
MSIHLVGGGWSQEHYRAVYGPFLEESSRLASKHTRGPRIAVVQLYDAAADDGRDRFAQFAAILRDLGPCRAVPVLVAEGDAVPAAAIDDLDGLLVAGGLTPAYLAAVTPVAGEIRRLVVAGLPYLGFSAGAQIAATTAIIGGWRSGAVPICDEDCGEDLDQVTTAPGLGLVDFAVDAHAAQWGTLTRAITAVDRGDVDRAVAVDESTACIVTEHSTLTAGAGQCWWVQRTGAGVVVRADRGSPG